MEQKLAGKVNGNANRFFVKDPEAYYINANGNLRCQSVHRGSRFRFEKAKLEAQKTVVPIEDIIGYINGLFSEIGIVPVADPKMDPKKIDYTEIKNSYDLDDERDLIWMKFTKDHYLGVIAQSNDVNFDIPTTAEDYDKREHGGWKHTTSGIIIHSLRKEWDETYVLLFPLKRASSCTYDRHDIETAVGNYLISKGVAVLDYYSHNY